MTLQRTARAAEDYRALREAAMRVEAPWLATLGLSGPDTRSFLQGLATQDLAQADPARGLMTFFTTEKGRPIALAWIALDGDATAWIVADEVEPGALLRHFERFRVMEEVELEPLAGTAAAFAGPHRDRLLADTASGIPGSLAIQASPLSFLVARTTEDALASSPPADAGAAEAWRLGIGLPRAGLDFGPDRLVTELTVPDAISFTKGCFVGQEVVARTSHRGQVRRARAGFTFEWSGGGPAPGIEIRAAGGHSAGFITSASPEPGMGRGFAMGYLSTEPTVRDSALRVVQEPTTISVDPHPWPLWG